MNRMLLATSYITSCATNRRWSCRKL